MHRLSEAGRHKNRNCKADLIWLIRERAKIQGKNMKNYTHKELNNFTKAKLFCIFGKIDFEYKQKRGF